jgi:hypothetical protein
VTRPDLGLAFDCAEPAVLAAFWCVALGYEPAPPPAGWSSWEDWARDLGVPLEELGDGASIHDPSGRGPGISFLRVPEGKVAKNRVHLDVKVSGGRTVDPAVRTELIEAHVARLVAAGGIVLERHDGPGGSLDHVVMADPEGDELCVV